MGISKKEFEKKIEELRLIIRESTKPFKDDSPKAKAARMVRSRKNMLYFGKMYFPHYFTKQFAKLHRDLAKLCKKKGKKAVAAPRGFGKSVICSFLDPIHRGVFKLMHFFILISSTETNAAEFLIPIKLEFEENERLRNDFGNQVNFGFWSDNDFVVKNGIRYLGIGQGQKIRGRRFRQYRPDVIVIEDIEDDEVVKKPRRVKKIVDWIKRAVLPALEKNGSFMFVETMLSKNSVLAQVMEFTNVESKIFKAIVNGKSTWAAMWPLYILMKEKGTIGSIAFNQEFQQQPRDDEDRVFKEGWIVYYSQEELISLPLKIYSWLDPAATKEGCYKAIITIGLDSKNIIYYVLNAWIRRASIDSLLRSGYNIYDEYNPIKFGIEKNGFQALLAREYDHYAKEKGYYLPIVLKDNTENKDVRIERRSPLIERGKIRFLKGNSDQDLLIEQLIYFPDIEKDGPDALDGVLQLAEISNKEVGYQSAKKRRAFFGRGAY